MRCRLRALFAQVRIEFTTFAGVPAPKVIGGASQDQWWRLTLRVEDGAELAGLIAEARTTAHNLSKETSTMSIDPIETLKARRLAR